MRSWLKNDVEFLVWETLEGTPVDAIAKRLRACRKTVLDMQRELELRGPKRTRWTDEELAIVRAKYFATLTSEIAVEIGRPERSIWNMAQKMGLKKSPELIASMARERSSRADHGGRKHRFEKGIVPHNKGKRQPGWSPGRMRDTQFRKGNKPHTWRPIGTERLTKEGYLQRKVADTGNTVADYVEVHRIIWEEAKGPIPPGCVLVFKDGDRRHIVLDNLEVITRAELARRNTIHKLPEELKEVIRLNASIKRRIRKIHAEKQDDRLEEPSIRDPRVA